jgi:hypothetical protein
MGAKRARWTLAAALAVAAALPAVAQINLPRIFAVETTLRGSEEEEIRWPVAVAVASADEFAVADAHQPRLLRFRRVGVSWQLDLVAALPAAPVGLAFDGARYVVSLRGGAGLVALEGEQLLQRRIGIPRDVVPGPAAGRPGGGLLLYDFASGRVLTLDGDGKVTGGVAVEGRVTGLTAAPAGGFFVALGDRGIVRRHDVRGAAEATWEIPGVVPVPAWPVAMAVEPGEGLVVLDRHGDRMVLLDDSGRPLGTGARKGWEPGLLLFPAAVDRLPDGRYVVADEGNGRVQIFRRTDRGGSR